MDLIIISTGLFMIATGFLVKSSPNLIAGYNTMSEEKKKNVDIEWLSTYMRNGMILIGSSIIVGYYLFKWLGFANFASSLIMVITMVGVTFMVINAQSFDRNSNKTKTNKLIYAVLGLVVIFVVGLLTYGSMSSKAIIGEDKIKFTGIYGFELKASEIEKVALSEQIPSIKLRTNGFSFGTVNKGRFHLEDFGKTQLLMHSDQSPFLIISRKNSDNIIVNFKDKAKTEQVYKGLSSFISDINPASSLPDESPAIYGCADDPTIQNCIATPKNFIRKAVEEKSFESYLRNLKLKPKGELVAYYNGTFKRNNNVYAYAVDQEIGKKDLHQCADAIMRLKADYHWDRKEYDKIHFNLTNGFNVPYKKWMNGQRVIVKGNKTFWNNGNTYSNTYTDFWKYLEFIFTYAGTASLEKELSPKSLNEAVAGDVFIQGGHPGHAILILDEALHPDTNEKIFLLGQSYMPAQQMQVLINPNDRSLSPWYRLNTERIITPEWTFSQNDLKAFSD